MRFPLRFSGRSVVGLVLVAVVMGGTVVACRGTPQVDDTGDPGGQGAPTAEQEVLEAHRALVHAYETADQGAFLSLLLPSADLLIFHPALEDRFAGIEEARAEIGRMFGRFEELTWTEAHPALLVEGDTAWVTSSILVESPDLEQPFVGRGTEIWIRHEGAWRLVHGHWSTQPSSQGG